MYKSTVRLHQVGFETAVSVTWLETVAEPLPLSTAYCRKKKVHVTLKAQKHASLLTSPAFANHLGKHSKIVK